MACGFHATSPPALFPFVPPPLAPDSRSLHLAEFDGTMLVGGSWWAQVALEIPAHIPQRGEGLGRLGYVVLIVVE